VNPGAVVTRLCRSGAGDWGPAGAFRRSKSSAIKGSASHLDHAFSMERSKAIAQGLCPLVYPIAQAVTGPVNHG
jgi:hypothetical protein